MTEPTEPDLEIDCVAHDTGQHLMSVEIRVTHSAFKVTREFLTQTLFAALGSAIAQQMAKPAVRTCPFLTGQDKAICDESCANGVCLKAERWSGRNR